MCSNLANVYASLLQNYGESYMITYASAPTYLNNIVGAAENPGKIILFYMEDCSNYTTFKYVSPTKADGKTSELDLTGSPLKDECEVDTIDDTSLDLNLISSNPWKPEEEYHKGIHVDKVRTFISSEDFQNGDSAADANGSVWFLCTGADFSRTLLLQYGFAKNQSIRGTINYKGTIASRNVMTQSLMQEHYNVVGKEATVETQIENIYNIKSSTSIKCSWSTVSAAPSLIDLRNSDVILKQTFCFGNSASSTQDFLNQLRLLMAIRSEIIAFKKSENLDVQKEPIYSSGVGFEMVELREILNKVMTEISEIDTSSDAGHDLEIVLENAKKRRLNDLTDKLWDILKECKSYKDLKMAFNVLFQCAAHCNIVNTPTNKNRLAEIITEVANRRLAIPCLSGSEPLELLLEIGMEKLYKDYEYIFVESKICSSNDLRNKSMVHDNKENDDAVVPNVRKSLRNAVMQNNASVRKTLLHNDGKGSANKIKNEIECFKNSNFDEHESAKTMARLLQIHCTLEHLLMIHINLNLSIVFYEVCDQLLCKTPRFIDSIYNSLTDEMEIQLSAHYVRDFLKCRDPYSRRIVMKSKNKFREINTTFYFSIENICPPKISECFNVEEKKCTKEIVYHNWLYRKITAVKSR